MKKIPSKTFLSLVFFFLSLKIWFIEVLVAQNTATIPVNVGVVLDLEFSGGNIDLTCINMALSDFYATHSDYKTRLVLTTRNSGNDVVRAAAAGSLSDPSFLSNCWFDLTSKINSLVLNWWSTYLCIQFNSKNLFTPWCDHEPCNFL